VDEAEVHLHYDAQADVVGVFEAQELADRIIYTTHSAGSLPRDLGRSVRVVQAAADADRSTVKNQFWELGPGATPLIMSMGATTLAFASARYAVFAEGASDHLLLPSLMREARELSSLPFQVLPGLASSGPAGFGELQLGASRSAFLVDGDDGGEALRKSLIESGIPPGHVIRLGRRARSGLQLEDMVEPAILCAAVNEELRRWSPEMEREIVPSSLPKRMRANAISEWCRQAGLAPPGRAAIAVRILALLQKANTYECVADPARMKQIHELYEDCMNALGIPL
jgi:predicted ATP-dependent endonuclease of OLD family